MKENGLPERIGSYDILGQLGRGGMGVVYSARDTRTGRDVAVKTIFVEEVRQRMSLQREIRTLARLNHPGVVKILEEGVDEGRPWFAMEFLQGIPLDRYCRNVVWQSSSFQTQWTSPDSDTPGTPGASDRGWEKLFGTTMDSDQWHWYDSTDHPPEFQGQVGVPKPAPDGRFAAAAGRLPDILSLCRNICAPLAYLHGEGLVHGDLKPSNIWIQKDGMPVLMDFGLMLEFWGPVSRDDLDTLQTSGGTLMYISPEQLTGRMVDARADLYSLGCIMYQLVTGHLPFRAQSISGIVQGHVKLKPVRPSELVDGVPPELDDLVINLLAKDPRDRIGHAQGVARVLKQLGARDSGVMETVKPRAYLYRPGFAGRDDLLKVFAADLDRLDHGTGGLVLLGGESGIGKTRFLMEFSRAAARKHILTVAGECPSPGTGRGEHPGTQPPLHALHGVFETIAQRCSRGGETETIRVLGARGRILARYFPFLRDLPGLSRYPDPAELPPQAARLRLITAISQTFAALAETTPVLLLMDDIQWADDLTRNLLLLLLKSGLLTRQPILIVGSYRTEEISPEILRMIESRPEINRILEPLGEASVRAIVSDMLAFRDPSPAFISFLYGFSEGNPFFVAEYLRACLEESLLVRDDQGHWHILPDGRYDSPREELESLPLPRSLRHLVDRRLASVSGLDRELMETCSVMGREIDLMLLWNVMTFTVEVLDAVDHLINRRIMEETAPGRLQFVHDIFQSAAYSGMDPERRKTLHRKTAEAISGMDPGRGDFPHAEVARHWEMAGELSAARDHYETAARNAVACYAIADAEGLFRSYLNLVTEPDARSITARNILARNVLAFLAKTGEAVAEHDRALAESRAAGNRSLEADSLMGLAQLAALRGNHEDAKKSLRNVLIIYKELEDARGEANAMSLLASILSREGVSRDILRLQDKSLDRYRKTGDRDGEARVLSQKGIYLFKLHELDDAFDHFTRALALHRENGLRHMEAHELKNQGMVFLARHDYENARRLCEQSLAIVREIGERRQEGGILGNLAIIYGSMGETDRAMTLYEECITAQLEVGDRFFEALARGNYGFLLYQRGKIEAAETQYQTALGILRKLNIRHHMTRPMYGLAVLERQVRGNLDAAEAMVMEGMSLLDGLPEHSQRCSFICEGGHIALARGNKGEAYLKDAKQLVEEFDLEDEKSLTEDIHRLADAVAASKQGAVLYRGQIYTDLPEGVRAWLESRGEGAAGKA